jgi:hypothetical protein
LPVDRRLQFRLALCGHKAIEAGAVCLVLMVGGSLGGLTLAHLAVASKTGVMAVTPALAVTFTRHARQFANRWVASLFLGVCTFAADALAHESHYPGALTEAALTAVGAFLFSLAVSYTPIGRKLDHMAESFGRAASRLM